MQDQQQQQQQQDQQQDQHQQRRRPRTAIEAARSTGLFKDYLTGLDSLRSQVADFEHKLAKAVNEFYESSEKDESAFNSRMIEVNAAFELANKCLDSHGQQSVIVDGQAPIAALVNKVKSVSDPCDLTQILEFWESFKLAVEQLQTIADGFERQILSKLRTGCLQSSGDSTTSQLTKMYQAEAAAYAKELEQTRTKIRLLSHSAGSHMRLELISRSSHLDRVLLNCNDDFYPILCVVPDLTVKLESMIRVAYQWLDRDETYLFDVSKELRDRRSETKEMEQQLREQRERHRHLLKSVKSAFLVCQNSRRRLRQINAELKSLEEQIAQQVNERNNRIEEKKQKTEMADFLNISISQTKMNYTLQLKRQRLMSQIQELESILTKVETQIGELKSEIQAKTATQKLAESQSQTQETNFAEMKTDLDSYTKKVQQMSTELRSVRHQLSHLEGVQSLKTSPEIIDSFFEQQKPVKLAPSLKQSIDKKRRRVKQGK